MAGTPRGREVHATVSWLKGLETDGPEVQAVISLLGAKFQTSLQKALPDPADGSTRWTVTWNETFRVPAGALGADPDAPCYLEVAFWKYDAKGRDPTVFGFSRLSFADLSPQQPKIVDVPIAIEGQSSPATARVHLRLSQKPPSLPTGSATRKGTAPSPRGGPATSPRGANETAPLLTAKGGVDGDKDECFRIRCCTVS